MAVSKSGRVLTVAMVVCVMAPCESSLAQDSTDQRSTDTDIEEIIVTATRREQALQTVPLSVHVLTEDEIARLGATEFAGYARTVPGLSFTDGGTGGEKQTIRGISANPWFEVNNGTAVHLDEVPITSAGGTTGPPFNPDPVLFDINRIEVLRGPQGTLFGAGSMGGAIRIITNQPDTDQFAAGVDTLLTSTTDGEIGYGLSGMVNAPLSDGRAALRAVAFQRDLGGFVDNVLTGQDDVDNRNISGVRLAGKFAISDNASVTGRIHYQDRTSDGKTSQEPASGERQQSRIAEPIDDNWTNYNIVFDVGLDWGNLISSTSYMDRTVENSADVSGFLTAFFGLDNPLTSMNKEVINEFVQEIRLVSASDLSFDWLVGAFFQDQDQNVNQDFPSPGFDALTGGLASMFGPPDNLFVRRENFSLEQFALYGEIAFQFANRFELTAGGRWYDIDRNYTADNRGLLFVMGQLQESFSTGESGVIPKAGINFTASEQITLYGVVSAGFRPGGINPPGAIMEPSCAMELEALGFTSTPTSYESDSLVNYEAGARFQLPGGRTRINAAAYHIDWSDMQSMRFLFCGTGFFENAGKAQSNGIEFEMSSRFSDAFDYSIAASFNEAELTENAQNFGGMDGDRLPGVPEFTASANANYQFNAIGNKTPTLGLDVQYVGSSYMDFNSATSSKIPSYTVANLRLALQADGWTAAVFAHNLFDEAGLLFVNDNILGQWSTPIRPRTVGISLNWQF